MAYRLPKHQSLQQHHPSAALQQQQQRVPALPRGGPHLQQHHQVEEGDDDEEEEEPERPGVAGLLVEAERCLEVAEFDLGVARSALLLEGAARAGQYLF
jgi:hypothetical protein